MPGPSFTPPFALQRIDHIVLRVRDIAASIAFYQHVIGCTVEKRRPDLGLVHLRAGSALIDLVALDGALGRRGGAGAAEAGRNLDHFCLRIDPFVAADILAHLARHDVKAESNEVVVQYGADGDGPALIVRDPDGNTIELKGPGD